MKLMLDQDESISLKLVLNSLELDGKPIQFSDGSTSLPILGEETPYIDLDPIDLKVLLVTVMTGEDRIKDILPLGGKYHIKSFKEHLDNLVKIAFKIELLLKSS